MHAYALEKMQDYLKPGMKGKMFFLEKQRAITKNIFFIYL